MSSNNVKCKAFDVCGIDIDTFEIRVQDLSSTNYLVLDDEYAAGRFKQLPYASNNATFGKTRSCIRDLHGYDK